MAIFLKLSKRLKQIEYMVESDYAHIWDCCCDHGYLGMSLLSKNRANTIHFVDVVPELLTKIENTLQKNHSKTKANWKTYYCDVAELPLGKCTGKQLVIIAGIGADLMSRMISEIRKKHPNLPLDFLLCPVRRQFTIRNTLINLEFNLKDEILIEDKKRFYEVLLVSTPSNNDQKQLINPVGFKIWHSNTDKQALIVKNYLSNTLNYYRRVQRGEPSPKVNQIIQAYEAVLI